MRFTIFGAGAIGGTIGALLKSSGHAVSVIARGAHLEAIQTSGLRLIRPMSDDVVHVQAYASPAEAQIESGDCVILAVKSQHTADALDALANHAPKDINVVCAQNGVDNERQALRLFDRVYGMCVMLPSEHLSPGVVRAFGAPNSGILDLGRFPDGVDGVAERIAAALESSGFSSRPVDDPMWIKYGKLIRNLHNGVEALGGEAALATDLPDRVREEGRVVLARAGIEFMSAEQDEARRSGVLKRMPIGDGLRGGRSSWQSLARGSGSIESDYINGEISLLGRLHGIPTPVNDAVQQLSRTAARDGRDAGSFSVEEIEAAIAAGSGSRPA